MSELVRKALNRIENGELNIWDLCMHGEAKTGEFPCSDCSLCGGHRTCPIRFELDLRDDIAAERARCLEIVEKVLAADSDLIADRIPSECEVASESRLIELVWQAAAKECLKQIRGQNG